MSKLPIAAPLQKKETDWNTGDTHRHAMNLPPLPQEDGIPSIPRSAALPNLSTRISPYSNKGYVGLSENDSRTLEVLNNISITVSSIINQINKLFQRSRDNASFLQELQTVVKRLSDTSFQNVESQKSVQDLHYLLETQISTQNHQVSELVKDMNKATSLEIRKELGVCLAHLKKGALDIDHALNTSLQKQSDELLSVQSTNENLNSLQGTLQGICDNLQQVFPSQEKWNSINASLFERNTELDSLAIRNAEYTNQLHAITQKLMITDEATDVQRDLISKLQGFVHNQANQEDLYQKQSLLYENWKEVVASHENDSDLLHKFHTTYNELEKLVNSFSYFANGEYAQRIEDLRMGHENVSNVLKEHTQVLLNVQQNMGSALENQERSIGFSSKQEALITKLQDLIDRLLYPGHSDKKELQTPTLPTGESLYEILTLLHRKLYIEEPKDTTSNNLKAITTDLSIYLNSFKDEVSRMSSLYTGSSFSSKTLSLLMANGEQTQEEANKENNYPELKVSNKNNQELHEHLNSTLTLRNNTLLDNIASLEVRESTLIDKIYKLELSYTQLNMDYDKVQSHFHLKQTAVQELENRSIRLEERLRMLQKWSTNSSAQDNNNASSEPIPRVVTPPPIDQSSLTNKKKRVPYNTTRNSANLETLDQQRTPNKRFSSFSGSSKVVNRPATASSDKRKPSWSRRFAVALGLSPHSEEKEAESKNVPSSKKIPSPSKNRSLSSKM
ncbi:ubiquitin domain-like protein Blt1 [Schizosaccharomyces osmophilus]|uniref:Ubiquitin domain-like protein Blt1 n=1 Tax=Schizosaccharomyces osmophilus TaxID=2545709 RepID=A0AAE9W9V9_9SCHI|nr:ubiquitin domain-like protein Blt1 [Schizosaccharomyces osmophilus]WBW72013.1 ubiquitin domain-like protein Blt1 [Schizosaccharomyces osmophilus]